MEGGEGKGGREENGEVGSEEEAEREMKMRNEKKIKSESWRVEK